VGFSGRIWIPRQERDEKDHGKYKNSRTSPAYDKSAVLYGWHHAREAIAGGAPCVIVEGQIDVIACHAFGLPGAVAPCGTAVTHQHLAMIAAATRDLIIMTDADDAGRAAARRIIPLAIEAGLSPRVARPPEGVKDAGELLTRVAGKESA